MKLNQESHFVFDNIELISHKFQNVVKPKASFSFL